MRHLKKISEHKFSWQDKEADENEKMYEYISESMAEFQDKYKVKIYNDENESTILIGFPGFSVGKGVKGIKEQMSDIDKLVLFLKDVDYLVEKICTNDEVTHSTQLTDMVLQLTFSWQNEDPF